MTASIGTTQAQTWVRLASGTPTNAATAVGAGNGATLYAGFGGAGAYKSTDNGLSWQAVNNGLADSFGGILAPKMFLRTSTGRIIRGGDNASWNNGVGGPVFYTDNAGGAWTMAPYPFSSPTANPGGIAFTDLAELNGNLFASDTLSAGVWKSTNNGVTWTDAGNGLPFTPFTGYRFARGLTAANGKLYVAMTSWGIWRSADGGNTWQEANNGNPGSYNVITGTIRVGNDVKAMPNGTLFAAVDKKVWRSTDEGASWQDVTVGILTISDEARRIAVLGNTLYVCLNSGGTNKVMESTDNGENFMFLSSSGLPGETVSVLAQGFSAFNGALYLACTDGLYRADLATATRLPVPPALLQTLPPSLMVNVGMAISLRVSVAGTPPLVYQWYRDGVLLPADTTNVLSLPSVVTNDQGTYKVVVSNSAGVVSNSVVLNVFPNAPSQVDYSFNPGVGYLRLYKGLFLIGAAYVRAIQPDGKILLGGDFDKVESTAANRLVRLHPDGSVDTSFNVGAGPSAAVRSLAVQSDGKILVGGDFLQYNGVYASGMVRLNPDGSMDYTFNQQFGFDGPVLALAVLPDGRILAGGSFATYNQYIGPRFVRLLPNGERDPSFIATNTPNNSVQAILVQPDGGVLIAGSFSQVGAASRSRLARFNPDGTLDTGFSGNGSSTINGLIQLADGRLVLTGDFTTYNGSYYGNVARIQGNGAIDPTYPTMYVSGTLPSEVYATNLIAAIAASPVVASAGSAVIGADLRPFAINTPQQRHLGLTSGLAIVKNPGSATVAPGQAVALNVGALGTSAISYQWRKNGGNLGGQVSSNFVINSVQAGDAGDYTVVVSNGSGSQTSLVAKVVVSALPVVSAFTNDAVVPIGTIHHFAVTVTGIGPFAFQWLQDGLPVAGATNAALSYFGVQGSHAGQYSVKVANAVGTVTAAVQRLLPIYVPGFVHEPFNPPNTSANSGYPVHTAIMPNGNIIVGGNFVSFAGTARTNLTMLNPDGTVFTGFASRTNIGGIGALAVQADGKILAGSTTGNLIRLNSDGTVDTNFVKGVTSNGGSISKIFPLRDGRLYVVGLFNSFNSTGRTNLALLNADGSVNSSGLYTQGGSVDQAALGSDDRLVFSVYQSFTSYQLRRFNADGSLDATFLLNLNGQVRAVAVAADGGPVVCGDFNQIGGQSVPSIVRLLPSGSLNPAFNSNFVLPYNTSVPAMLVQPDDKIIMVGGVGGSSSSPAAGIVRLDGNGTVDAAFGVFAGVTSGSYPNSLSYYPDGRVVVAGPFVAFNARSRMNIAMIQTERRDPAVIAYRADQIVNQGGSATFQVTPVAGDNLTYQWRRNGFDVLGANSPTLTLNSVTPASNGIYTVLVTSSAGTNVFTSGSLVVLGAPEMTVPPASPDAVTGNAFSLSVQAIGLAPLYYQWFKDGTPLGGFSTNPVFTVGSAAGGDSGNYTVTVSNSLGVASSAGCIVTVLTQPGSLYTGFSNVLGGGVVDFAFQRDGKIVVAATGYNPGLYRLHANGARDTNFVSNVGSVSTLRTLALDDQGRAYVGFNNGDIKRYLPNGTQESNYVANIGGVTRTFVLLCLPDGKTLVGRDSTLLRLNPDGTPDTTFTNVINEVYSLDLLANGKILLAHWAGYGYVRRLNADGSTDTTFSSLPANQLVYGALPLPDGRVLAYGWFGAYDGISKTFLTRLLANGLQDLSYSNAVPNNLISRMALQENGRAIMLGNFTTVGGINRTNLARLNADGSLDSTFTSAVPNSSASRIKVLPDGRVMISGGFTTINGVAHRGLAVLNGDIVNLGFLSHPVGGTFNVGSPLNLEATTTATSPVGYQWYRNGAPIVGATAAAYSVGATTTNHNGSYFVVATNLAGARTSLVAQVTILAAPVYLAQPASTNGYLNKSVSFNASVIGIAPLAVQWLKDGTPIANATNQTLMLTNLQFASAGAYALVASNSLGVVTSAVASLTISILQGSADLAFNAGGVGPNSTVTAVYTLPDGRIYVAGSFTTFNGSNTNRYIVRLNPDGTLDQSFAYNTNYQAAVLAVDNQGRLLAAGGNSLRRILPNGTTDPTFPAAGLTFTAPIAVIAVQPDGKILLGGGFTSPAFYLVRLNDDGTRDVTFNPAVGVVVDSLLLLPNGSFLVGTYNAGAIQLRRCFADGSLDNSWTSPSFGINGRIYSILPLADGKFLIAGGFSISSRLYLARINSNGTVDTSYTPPSLNGSIAQAIFQDDGKVLIRGSFDTIGSVVSRNFARLNADLTPDASFVSGLTANNQHNAMALQYDGRIILGGSFTSYDGNNKPYLAAAYGQPVALAITNPPLAQTLNLNAPLTLTAGVFAGGPVTYQWFKNGAPLAGSTSATLTINQAKTADSGLYSVRVSDGTNTRTSPGALVTVLGEPVFLRQPSSLITTQGMTASFAPIIQGQAPMAYQWWFNGAQLAGATNISLALPSISAAQAGQYRLAVTNAIGSATSADAYLSISVLPAGALDLSFATNSGASGGLTTLASAPNLGLVYVGGGFTVFDGVSRSYFARLNANGTLGTNYNPGLPLSSFNAIAVQPDGKPLLGGTFTYLSDQLGVTNYYGLGRLQTNGLADRSFANALNSGGQVFALLVQSNGQILVGGNFTNAGGLVRSNFARLSADGVVDAGFGAANFASSFVRAIVVQPDGKLLIGGDFTNVLGQARGRIARLNGDGTLDGTFTNAVGANSAVRAIAVQSDGKIVVGGDFNSFNGTARNYFIRLNVDGSVDTNFTATANSSVYVLKVVAGDKILAGGYFTSIAGQSLSYFTRLNPNGTRDTTFDAGSGPNNAVVALEPQTDGSLILGGTFNAYNGVSRGGLARVFGDGQLIPLINAQPAGTTAKVGESVSFSVGVAGLNPLRFQWRKDGTNLPGATNATLTLANLTTNNAGNYAVVITNTAGAITSTVAAVSVGLATGYAAWAVEQQLPGGLDAPGADADSDGVPNIVEYALGTNPKQAGSRQFPGNHLVRIANQDYPALRFIRLKSATGVTIQVEASASVTFGSLAGTTQEGVAEDLGDGTERVTIRVNTPLSQTPVMFFRTKVVAQ